MAALFFVPLIVILLAFAVRLIPRASIAPHLTGHPVYEQDDLIPKDMRKRLLENVRDMKHFMSNVDTAKSSGVVATYDHIGEAIPINADGTCSHPYLFPNNDRTRCILPERVDVGRHFIMTGGLDGVKEPFDDLMDRVSSFARYTFNKDLVKYPIVKELFESEKFQTAAKSVCPADQTYVDPFQFTFIINLPGQTVAAHLGLPLEQDSQPFSNKRQRTCPFTRCNHRAIQSWKAIAFAAHGFGQALSLDHACVHFRQYLPDMRLFALPANCPQCFFQRRNLRQRRHLPRKQSQLLGIQTRLPLDRQTGECRYARRRWCHADDIKPLRRKAFARRIVIGRGYPPALFAAIWVNRMICEFRHLQCLRAAKCEWLLRASYALHARAYVQQRCSVCLRANVMYSARRIASKGTGLRFTFAHAVAL